MSDTIDTPPTPPRHHEMPIPRFEPAKDVLGRELLKQEYFGLHDRLNVDLAEQEGIFLRDLQAFYDISDVDAEEWLMEDLDYKHEFPQDIYDFLEIQSWGSSTLAGRRESNKIRQEQLKRHTDTDQDLEASMEATIAHFRSGLIDQLRSKHIRSLVEEEFNNPKTKVPEHFNHLREQPDGSKMSWLYWLATGATPKQFMNFLQWHNHHMLEIQEDPGVKAEIAREKEEYIAAVEQGMEEGWLPDAAQLAIAYVPRVKANVVDIFGTLSRGLAGYHIPSDYQQIGNDIYVAETRINVATKHELNHSVLGELPYVWFNEAVTEHIAVSLQEGRFADFHEHIDKGVYDVERNLVDIILKDGMQKIAPEVVTRAYAAPELRYMSLDHLTDERIAFNQALHDAWGVWNVLELIDTAIEKETRYHQKQDPNLSHEEAYIEALYLVGGQLMTTPEEITGKPVVKR